MESIDIFDIVIISIIPIIMIVVLVLYMTSDTDSDQQEYVYDIMTYDGKFYIKRLYLKSNINDYEYLKYTADTFTFWTKDVREAKSIESNEKALDLITNNFNQLEDFTNQLTHVERYDPFTQAHYTVLKLIEADKQGNAEKAKLLVDKLQKIYN